MLPPETGGQLAGEKFSGGIHRAIRGIRATDTLSVREDHVRALCFKYAS